ncbi:hypothetical protein BSL78_29470 [Apostichopus japonicus]|uniref:Integrase core domain-containing protein n=1 Tax=Stichopus japonicus TaxID=307972 RepID=A0A2G8JD93_STIJA|nr:hypothetical protein BSL78_29470 [Apostichopus japonicus]
MLLSSAPVSVTSAPVEALFPFRVRPLTLTLTLTLTRPLTLTLIELAETASLPTEAEQDKTAEMVNRSCKLYVTMPAPLEYTAADLAAIGRRLRMPLIEHYFMQGFQGQEIVALLGLCHNISISLRHLKRLLRQLNLRRRRQASPVEDIAQVILRELEGSGRNIGYRLMWHRLNYIYGLRVTQDTTRRMLNIIDPDGVSRRSAHRLQRRVYMCPGPNHTIHIDGYDKLKPFGIAIHGAVDGFSRRLLWLKAGHSNNNPRLVAKYYIHFIRRSQGVPKSFVQIEELRTP